VPLPQRQKLLDSEGVELRGEGTDTGTQSGGFVDEGAEHVEHDGVDLRLCHGRSPGRSWDG
jgi:hypothetical protein